MHIDVGSTRARMAKGNVQHAADLHSSKHAQRAEQPSADSYASPGFLYEIVHACHTAVTMSGPAQQSLKAQASVVRGKAWRHKRVD
jgi:hypothetical protein